MRSMNWYSALGPSPKPKTITTLKEEIRGQEAMRVLISARLAQVPQNNLVNIHLWFLTNDSFTNIFAIKTCTNNDDECNARYSKAANPSPLRCKLL